MNNLRKTAQNLLWKGVCAINVSDNAHIDTDVLSLSPEYYVGSVETDIDILVDEGIAIENIMASLRHVTGNVPDGIDMAATHILFYMVDGRLCAYIGNVTPREQALADACERGFSEVYAGGEMRGVPSPQKGGTAYQRRTYAVNVSRQA